MPVFCSSPRQADGHQSGFARADRCKLFLAAANLSDQCSRAPALRPSHADNMLNLQDKEKLIFVGPKRGPSPSLR
jgi:hypothetical protein